MKIAIVGYGNLGKGVERALKNAPDIQCVGVFSRRNIKSESGLPVYKTERLSGEGVEVDALVLCGGSSSDLRVQTPFFASRYTVVDSFDDHERIANHVAETGAVATNAKTTALLCCGWDPGLFSVAKLTFASVLPEGRGYSFWGKGVSQGHSEAVKKIDGVIACAAYTEYDQAVYDAVKRGETPDLSPKDIHKRTCFVVIKSGANREEIAQKIKAVPRYFEGYETKVEFLSQEEFSARHAGFAHGGAIVYNGKTPSGNQNVELSLRLSSNPEFTGALLLSYARAAVRLNREGKFGAYTVLDVPPAYLSPLSKSEQICRFL